MRGSNQWVHMKYKGSQRWIPLSELLLADIWFSIVYSLLQLGRWKQPIQGKMWTKKSEKKNCISCYLWSKLILVPVKSMLFLLTLLDKGLVHWVLFWLLNHVDALKLVKPTCEAGRIFGLGVFKTRTSYNDCSGEKDSGKRMDLRGKKEDMKSKREGEKKNLIFFCKAVFFQVRDCDMDMISGWCLRAGEEKQHKDGRIGSGHSSF